MSTSSSPRAGHRVDRLAGADHRRHDAERLGPARVVQRRERPARRRRARAARCAPRRGWRRSGRRRPLASTRIADGGLALDDDGLGAVGEPLAALEAEARVEAGEAAGRATNGDGAELLVVDEQQRDLGEGVRRTRPAPAARRARARRRPSCRSSPSRAARLPSTAAGRWRSCATTVSRWPTSRSRAAPVPGSAREQVGRVVGRGALESARPRPPAGSIASAAATARSAASASPEGVEIETSATVSAQRPLGDLGGVAHRARRRRDGVGGHRAGQPTALIAWPRVGSRGRNGTAASRTPLGEPAAFEGGLAEVAERHLGLAAAERRPRRVERRARSSATGESLLVDTLWDARLTAHDARGGRARVTAAAGAPIATLLNTHGDGDHWYGNGLLAADVEIVATERGDRADARGAAGDADPARADRDRRRARGAGPAAARRSARCAGSPASARRSARYEFGGLEPRLPGPLASAARSSSRSAAARVELIEVGPAHTAGDAIAWVADARVVFAGDIVFNGVTPIMWAGPVRQLDRRARADRAARARGRRSAATARRAGSSEVRDAARLLDLAARRGRRRRRTRTPSELAERLVASREYAIGALGQLALPGADRWSTSPGSPRRTVDERRGRSARSSGSG